jgi:hypothetical protein
MLPLAMIGCGDKKNAAEEENVEILIENKPLAKSCKIVFHIRNNTNLNFSPYEVDLTMKKDSEIIYNIPIAVPALSQHSVRKTSTTVPCNSISLIQIEGINENTIAFNSEGRRLKLSNIKIYSASKAEGIAINSSEGVIKNITEKNYADDKQEVRE